MTRDAERPPHIEVIPATLEQQPIVANLLQLYAHDFSEFHDVELGADGRFDYPNLALYWREPSRHPFLVMLDAKLAGFAFVKSGSEISDDETIWDMAEFFVLRKYRRRGSGTKIAQEIFRRFTGRWEVRVMESNHSAHNFWQHAIAEFTGESIHSVRFKKSGNDWRLFSFESKRIE